MADWGGTAAKPDFSGILGRSETGVARELLRVLRNGTGVILVADGETVLEGDHAGAVDLAQHGDERLGSRDHDVVARLQGQVAVQAVAVPERGGVDVDALAAADDRAVRGRT